MVLYKISRWVMLQNVINAAFMTVTTVQEGVELLEVFAHLTKREVRNSSSLPLSWEVQ